MTRVLITGASGLLGTAFTRLVQDKGWQPTSLGRTAPDLKFNLPHVQADLATPLSDALLPTATDVVVHLAQSQQFREFPASARALHSINVETTLRLANYACRVGATTLVYASSGAVYAPSISALSEGSALRTLDELDAYSASKLASEVALSPYIPHLNIVILRPFFVYGPGQIEDRLIARLARQMLEGSKIELSGPDGLTLNPIFVEDAAEALLHCISMERSVRVNIAGPEVTTLRAIIETMAQIMGRKVRLSVGEGQSPSIVGSTSLLTALGYEPKIGLNEGLRAALDH